MTENDDGRISYIDVSAYNPSKILYVHKKTVLDIGIVGSFDDCGVCPSCIIHFKGEKLLFYFGVQRPEKLPYLYFAGLAIYDNKLKKFRKYSTVPILEKTQNEPFIRSATTVIEDNGILKMWYVSAHSWIKINNKDVPSYNIRYAISSDGITWDTHEVICIDKLTKDEFGFGRPWVIKENNIYKMWYSIRGKLIPYIIGYAESADGINWVRKDNEVGINCSKSGWDSQMICYPCIIDFNETRYMFYNGNGYGESGFGYAVLSK